ncbi:MAG: hypothetical protein ABI186_10390 [Candidatus Elarobacter sp.]
MSAAASDPAGGLRWLLEHPQNVIWFVAIAAFALNGVLKRLRSPQAAQSADVPDRRRALLDGLRLAAAAAKSAQAAAQRGRFAASAAPGIRLGAPVAAAVPAASTARTVVPAAAGAAARPPAGRGAHPFGQPAAAGRSPLLEAFRSPAGARTAVILAEILAPPVGLR